MTRAGTGPPRVYSPDIVAETTRNSRSSAIESASVRPTNGPMRTPEPRDLFAGKQFSQACVATNMSLSNAGATGASVGYGQKCNSPLVQLPHVP